MYGPNMNIRVGRRDEIEGEPLQRVDIQLANGSKNVLMVLRVSPSWNSEEIQTAAEWLGVHCEKMSGNTVKFHGVVIHDTDDYKFDIVEIDDEVTKS